MGQRNVTIVDNNGNAIGEATKSDGVTKVPEFHIVDAHFDIVNRHLANFSGVQTSVTSALIPGDITITVNDISALTTTARAFIFEGDTEEPDIVNVLNITTATSAITIDRPLDHTYTTAAIIERVQENMITFTGTLAAPIIYKVVPPSNEQWHITRILLAMQMDSQPDDGKFGDLVSLTNGVVVRQNRSKGTRSMGNWKNNSDMKQDFFDFPSTDKAGGGDFGLNGRWTFGGKEKSDTVISLNGAVNDALEVLIQDDLSALIEFEIKAQGYIEI